MLYFLQTTDSHFMDKSALGKEAREEITREALITISYTVPDKTVASKLSSESVNGEKLGNGDYDEAEKFRSQLIAISYSESPDIKGQPDTLGELKG
ncbi:hypothetical protein Pint_00013 [Pistacia integerrima]|uniref:Uncharacterized protein n=1 Tax=Pistacia integerrima TaxID=434235 RepID=A0ACC0ZGP9_9ROSI|nr:hypothetical protein Pint_00013 [Pistacia integerrima]